MSSDLKTQWKGAQVKKNGTAYPIPDVIRLWVIMLNFRENCLLLRFKTNKNFLHFTTVKVCVSLF